MVKIINRLSNKEIPLDDILALYTGEVADIREDQVIASVAFEKNRSDEMVEKDLVLHELNLLQGRYEFWVKIMDNDANQPYWFPARIDY